MKKKVAYIVLVIAVAIALLVATYVIFHITCGNTHLVRHIRLGMTKPEVEEMLGEPDAFTGGGRMDYVYFLGDGSEFWIHFSSNDPNSHSSKPTVHGYSYFEKGSGDISFILGVILVICAVCAGAAFFIRRILNRPRITLKGVNLWFIARKRKLAYIALVLAISIAVLCVASLIFHANCGTAHLAKHIRYGMSYDKVENLLGEPAGFLHSYGKLSPHYALDDGTHLYLIPLVDFPYDSPLDKSTFLDDTTVCGFRYVYSLPEPEIGLYIGAAVLICLVGGIDAFLIRRKWKQPTA